LGRGGGAKKEGEEARDSTAVRESRTGRERVRGKQRQALAFKKERGTRETKSVAEKKEKKCKRLRQAPLEKLDQ
jgi:hypothetical protein